jgi:catechol 2,3-dioxygenase-like lactoylglutathione lyase family enzyme
MPKSQPFSTAPQLVPRMLHHSGFVTHDAQKTVDFYSRILGMDFCSTVMDDRVPSTGEAFPYLHLFFRMGDGSTLAFFESPAMPAPSKPSHPAYDVFNHVALAAASKDEVDAWAARLRDNGVDVLGPVDHGIIYSIYFHDPNGIRLELTTTLDESWSSHGKEAVKDVADWVAAKQAAAAQGRDTVESLLELIGKKKAEMRARGIIGADELHSRAK